MLVVSLRRGYVQNFNQFRMLVITNFYSYNNKKTEHN